MPSVQRFLVQDGAQAGKTIDINVSPFTIGRARECSFVLDFTEISRLHAQCYVEHLNIFLEDMGSTNGTFVNERRLEIGERYRLRAGDVVRFARVCTVIFDDPATTSQIDPVDLPVPGLELDRDAAQVTIASVPLHPPLSPHQFSLLDLLVRNEGRIVTRDEVVAFVWGPEEDVSDQTIDALVSRLRKRLINADPGHEYLVTRRGFGLMFQNRF